MEKKSGRVDINLKASVCTESPTGIDIFPFGDKEATSVTNTGMERQGGLTPIYEQETSHPSTGQDKQFYIAKNGKVLSVNTLTYDTKRVDVKVDGNVIGAASAYGVLYRQKISNVDDVIATTAGYMTVKATTAAVTDYIILVLTAYSDDGTVMSTRSLNFGVINRNSTVSFIRYGGAIIATDPMEFVVWGSSVQVYRETGLAIVTPGYTVVGEGHLSAYRFENSHYLIGMPGVAGSYQMFTNADAKEATATTGVWAMIQYANSKSRALITHTPAITASNIEVVSLMGYQDFVNWTLGPTFQTTTVDASALLGYSLGFGYMDVRYNRTALGTAIYQIFSPDFLNQTGMTALTVRDNLGGSDTSIDAYGKLIGAYTSAYIVALPINVRFNLIAGKQSFLSAAYEHLTVSAEDNLGVILTGVGEIEDSYYPQVYMRAASVAIVYQFGDDYFFLSIASMAGTTTPVISEISPSLYKVNTITPYNVIDAVAGTLELGSLDYHGAMKWKGTAFTAIHKWVTIIQGKYAQSIDTGDKLVTCTTAQVPILPGTAIPAFMIGTISNRMSYSADTYYDDVYWRSVHFGGGYAAGPAYAILDKANLLYVIDTLLPVAMGSVYAGNFTARTRNATLFLQKVTTDYLGHSHEFDGYLIGNNVFGVYDSFSLFGQIYLFDGLSIWAATFNGTAYQSRDFICLAQGMTLIASAPTQIYFLSSYDNSIYVFDGGRSLTKYHRLTDEITVTDGVYSTVENTLLLQTASTFIWVRDSVISVDAKKANQTATALYTTSSGIVISNNVNKWIYSYLALSSSTVVPLTYQGSYFGFGTEAKAATVTYHVTLYSPTKAAADVTLVCYAFDETEYTTQTEYLHVNAGDWAANGFYRCRIQPKNQKAVAASVGVAFTTKLILVRVSVEYAADEAAVLPGARSR